MTLDEAKIIAKITASADGGCSSCVGALHSSLIKEFPNLFTEEICEQGIKDFEIEEYGKPLNDF
jgi:hypothetical protein